MPCLCLHVSEFRRGLGQHNLTLESKLPADPGVNAQSRGSTPRLFSLNPKFPQRFTISRLSRQAGSFSRVETSRRPVPATKLAPKTPNSRLSLRVPRFRVKTRLAPLLRAKKGRSGSVCWPNGLQTERRLPPLQSRGRSGGSRIAARPLRVAYDAEGQAPLPFSASNAASISSQQPQAQNLPFRRTIIHPCSSNHASRESNSIHRNRPPGSRAK